LKNKLKIKLPIIFLGLSIISLLVAILFLIVGSRESRLYNQMKKATVVSQYNDIINSGNSSFLLHGYIKIDHKTVNKNMVASETIEEGVVSKNFPPIIISLGDKDITLKNDYEIADFNISINDQTRTIQGIKPGGEVTIYAVNCKDEDLLMVKGYELYPGSPKQYINFLKSPYSYYMIFVRFLIGVALLHFLVSIVLNIKK